MDTYALHPPQKLLGYAIRSHTRIYVSYLLPASLELICFIAQITADAGVSYQHFRSQQTDFGWATLALILTPPVVTFVLVLSSAAQWSNPGYAKRWHFVANQVLFLAFFPFVAIFRLARRVFWSIEALFQDNDDEERILCLAKAEECSTCELYHLIQAYGQSAPQIMLQLYHMLSQDLFRNFETTNAQAISLFFSAVDVAAVTTTYQRFEKQKLAGRHYPWSSPRQVEVQQSKLKADKDFREEFSQRKRESERRIVTFPENDEIMANFNQRGRNTEEEQELQNLATKQLQTLEEEVNANEINILDTVPDSPAPALPSVELRARSSNSQANTSLRNAREKRTYDTLSQLDVFKDMLIVNAQLYIKEHMPRPPKILVTRVTDDVNTERQQLIPTPQSPLASPVFANQQGGCVAPDDNVHTNCTLTLPQHTRVVEGMLQDDFAGKTIAFCGWIAFVIMRMLSLSTFAVFFPKAFLFAVAVHYSFMLMLLFLESVSFHGKYNRRLFYLLLAYVFIFVLIEFRVKFKRIRLWVIGYLIGTLCENITMALMWYTSEDFESWWFQFIFEGIIYSGILSVMTLLVYYAILKPKDVTLITKEPPVGKQNSKSGTDTEYQIIVQI